MIYIAKGDLFTMDMGDFLAFFLPGGVFSAE